MKTALVVSDEFFTTDLITRTLNTEGFVVLHLDNPDEIQQVMQDAKPDLVVSDHRVPKDERLLKQLDAMLIGRFLFFIDTDKERETAERLQRLGKEFLKVPVTIAEIRAKVRKILEEVNGSK